MNVLAAGRLFGPDYFIIVAYFALMLGVGAYFYRYMKAMKDYFTGANQIPWWLSGISYYMSSFSAFAFISYSALAFQYGLVGVALYWVTVPAAFFSTHFFATRWRRARIHSPVEYLESRYSPAVRQVFAWQGVPVKLIDDALKLLAIGTFLVTLLGGTEAMTPQESSAALERTMLWAGGIMLAYTFMGGLWAVMITDFMQFLVQSAAVVILFPLAFGYAFAKVGGLSGFIENSPDGFFSIAHREYDWVYLTSTIVLYFLSYSVNWSLVQRFYCVPREKDARKVGYLVVFLNIVTPPLMFMPAMAAYHFVSGLDNANKVFPEICALLLPMGLVGLMIAAMFSATMSMLSADYNVCASVLTNDIYRRLIRPSASQKELVFIGRVTTLLVGVISLGVAFYMNRVGSGAGDKLFRSMVTLFSIAVPPVAIPMLWGLLSRRINSTSALSGFIIGVGSGLMMLIRWPASLFGRIPEEGIIFAGTSLEAHWKLENLIFWTTGVITLITVIVVNRLVRQSAAERNSAEQFLERLKLPIGQLSDDQSALASRTISPFRIVGICTILVGAMLVGITPWVSGEGTVSIAKDWARELNFGLGLAMVAIGGIVTWHSRRKAAPQAAEGT